MNAKREREERGKMENKFKFGIEQIKVIRIGKIELVSGDK